jgi:hypothetical protein
MEYARYVLPLLWSPLPSDLEPARSEISFGT